MSIHKLPPPPQAAPVSSAAPAWPAPTAAAAPAPAAPPAEPLHASRAITNGQMKAVARSFSTEGMEILAAIARDNDAPHSARVTAANSLLDRGHGKAVQQVEAGKPGDFLEDLTDAELDAASLEMARKVIAEHENGLH